MRRLLLIPPAVAGLAVAAPAAPAAGPPFLSVSPRPVHLGDNGRFTRRFTPRSGQIGPGRWRVVARLRCESGKDGSPNFITRKRTLRILP